MHSTSSTTTRAETGASVKHVSKFFGGRSGVQALKDVSLEIGSGEIIALLGPNGAGKSTLIDLLLGLTTPTSGEVEICGTSPRTAVERSQIGAVLQTGGLLPDLSVEKTVRLIASTFAHTAPLEEVLERANLTALRRRKVQALSGGEKQRLRFALALLGEPSVLILDEPTAGMDPTARHEFWESMRAQASHGTTILFATHYLEEAQNFAERIVLLTEGSILADGSVDEIRHLGSAQHIEAEFPSSFSPEELSHSPAAELLGGVEHRGGGTWRLSTTDSDALARYLLNHTAAKNLQITAASLDDTFLAITSEGEHA
ncbi:putative ABC transporter ATP-binding protein YbhF [Corynebacterium ciconiae DSM 44920]|uniref:ABC transporter ATP-binding protein n=1 Tax=Corynebacterium ciconiae TaxID=227319 RepID=UPI00037B8A35|nr:ABC transporter ATP-binding protein [Corynebacterium ciconiae]WKD60144.1 putative ABC transporter ATP-binding protein YbhF [Corynebacterium ciconiae DSM 44920]